MTVPMGAFFTNVQVEAPTGADALARIEKAIRKQAKRDGMVEATGDDPVDRALLLRAADGWVSVYDQATESQDTELLDALGKALSRATGTHAFSVVVHDSDIVELRLFHAGKRIDRYNSHPDYFGDAGARERKACAGKPERWKPLLCAGTAADLRAVWSSKKLMAEQTLADTVRLFGIDPERVATGYRYATEDEPDATDRVRLAFRYRERPAYDTDAEGPACFEPQAFSERVDLAVGYTVPASWSVRNAGGASLGFTLVVWGEALERGLVSVSSVNVVVGPPKPEHRFEGSVTPTELTGGQRGVRVDFPHVRIPAGARDLAAAMSLAPDQLVEVMYRSNVHANIELTGLAPGDAPLSIGFLAAADPAIQHGFPTRVAVSPAPRRPPRALPDADLTLLLALEEPSTLLALVSLDLPRAEAARRVAPLIERWAARFRGAELETGVFPADCDARPITHRAPLAGYFQGAGWKALRHELGEARRVSLALDRDFFAQPRALGAGFTFGGSLYGRDDPDDPELPQLGLWIPARDVPDDVTAADERLLVELMDAIMTEHRGIQALVCRWDWAPDLGFEATPYEHVCGVYGTHTLRRSYLRKNLRAVTPGTFWVGAQMQMQEAIEELRATGDVEVKELAGGAVRISAGAVVKD